MADEEKPKDDRPLGQVLMERLAVAMLENNDLLRQFITEVRELREQMEENLEVQAELSNQLAMGFRVLDYLTDVGKDRRIHWGDVADVLGDIRKELAEQDAAADEEEQAEGEGETEGEGKPEDGKEPEGEGEADPKEETKRIPVPIPTSTPDEKKPQEIFSKDKPTS